MELACVIVPLCTENWLRFSARLDEGAPEEVRFERAVTDSVIQESAGATQRRISRLRRQVSPLRCTN
jgi:hypothetical protein